MEKTAAEVIATPVKAWPGRRLPWLIAGLSLVMMVVGLALILGHKLRSGTTQPVLSHQELLQLSTLLYAVIGGLIASRHPRNAIGWLFLVTSFFTGLAAVCDGILLTPVFGLRQPGVAALAAWIDGWDFLPASILPTVFLFLLFPDGRPPGRRWVPILWLAAISFAGVVLSVAFNPGNAIKNRPYVTNPFGIPGAGPFLDTSLNIFLWLMTFGAAASIAALVLRFRGSEGVERQQMKWLVFAVGLTVTGGVLAAAGQIFLSLIGTAAEELGYVTGAIGVMCIAVAVGFAILRYRLYDIDLVINRTLVYSSLTAAVLGVYLLVVGGLGLLFQSRGGLGASLLAVGVVALVVQPARERLQRTVNRLLYGERDDPYAALSRLGRRLEGTLAPDAVLPVIVETVAQTLKLPYAAVSLALPPEARDDAEAEPVGAVYGTPTADPLVLPLVYQSETIGTLEVGPRSGEPFSSADRRLLADLARQAGVAMHAVRLTADLLRSRRRLVTTREEERRRLRRDLHDGLGSQLAGLHLRIDTLRTLIPGEATAARRMAADLRDEVHGAIDDIRRLVYDLRPPALDELGLEGAVRALAANTSRPNLKISIETPAPLPELPAAVEVAAYRIAQESLANIVHHAQARSCLIRLALAGSELCLEIKDDGVGLPAGLHAGVGLRSMNERAAELGGECHIENVPSGGARVAAHLPLPAGSA